MKEQLKQPHLISCSLSQLFLQNTNDFCLKQVLTKIKIILEIRHDQVMTTHQPKTQVTTTTKEQSLAFSSTTTAEQSKEFSLTITMQQENKQFTTTTITEESNELGLITTTQ